MRNETVVAIECLSCRHRAIMGANRLVAVGATPDLSLVELSRHLVCGACGSGAVRAFRINPSAAVDFLAEHESIH